MLLLQYYQFPRPKLSRRYKRTTQRPCPGFYCIPQHLLYRSIWERIHRYAQQPQRRKYIRDGNFRFHFRQQTGVLRNRCCCIRKAHQGQCFQHPVAKPNKGTCNIREHILRFFSLRRQGQDKPDLGIHKRQISLFPQ